MKTDLLDDVSRFVIPSIRTSFHILEDQLRNDPRPRVSSALQTIKGALGLFQVIEERAEIREEVAR